MILVHLTLTELLLRLLLYNLSNSYCVCSIFCCFFLFTRANSDLASWAVKFARKQIRIELNYYRYIDCCVKNAVHTQTRTHTHCVISQHRT